MYFDSSPPSSGVQPVPAQSTDEAARQALEPQKHGDEFKPKESPDIKALISRLNELEAECTQICDKLYMMAPGGSKLTWVEREKYRERLNEVEREKGGIQGLLKSIYDGYS